MIHAHFKQGQKQNKDFRGVRVCMQKYEVTEHTLKYIHIHTRMNVHAHTHKLCRILHTVFEHACKINATCTSIHTPPIYTWLANFNVISFQISWLYLQCQSTDDTDIGINDRRSTKPMPIHLWLGSHTRCPKHHRWSIQICCQREKWNEKEIRTASSKCLVLHTTQCVIKNILGGMREHLNPIKQCICRDTCLVQPCVCQYECQGHGPAGRLWDPRQRRPLC